jgi:hypothetical protein
VVLIVIIMVIAAFVVMWRHCHSYWTEIGSLRMSYRCLLRGLVANYLSRLTVKRVRRIRIERKRRTTRLGMLLNSVFIIIAIDATTAADISSTFPF